MPQIYHHSNYKAEQKWLLSDALVAPEINRSCHAVLLNNYRFLFLLSIAINSGR